MIGEVDVGDATSLASTDLVDDFVEFLSEEKFESEAIRLIRHKIVVSNQTLNLFDLLRIQLDFQGVVRCGHSLQIPKTLLNVD